MHIDDINNKKAVHAMLPEQYRDPFDHEPGITKMIADVGSPRKKCKFPDYTSVIRRIDDFPNDGASMVLAWRLCSGMSHGTDWAALSLIPQTNRQQIGPTLHRAEITPNYQIVSSLTGTAVRTIERAHCLFEIRRTTRPHSIRMQQRVPDLNAGH
ncbi:hypothetical protein [Nocardia wallacei]|uniref:hypothetical protein n=1 Tax=Nocardia wallacei TaxID=480035 RepID=UPI002457786F|nr:hypothetical protein [Nocardia wallacei]